MSQASGKPHVDESLYSRQLYVFGHDAQHKMSATDVLIVGLGGLGVEVGTADAAPYSSRTSYRACSSPRPTAPPSPLSLIPHPSLQPRT